MDFHDRRDRMRGMRAKLALTLLILLALSVPASASAKGSTRVVLVGSDGRSVEVRAGESEIDGLLSRRGLVVPLRGGYARLFFVGPGEFPANSARYYPDQRCVALDWPSYERSCGRVNPTVVRLLHRARMLARFRDRPTVLARVAYRGRFPGLLKTAAALKGPVELALDRTARAARQPRRCYSFTGGWRGPAAALRPRRFLLCAAGVYAGRRLYPLRRGAWEWFQLNVGPPTASGGREIVSHGVEVTAPMGWQRVTSAGDGPVTDPRTLLVVGTGGVRPSPTQCQIAAYRVPATGAVVVIVGWSTATSGGGNMKPGRWPLKALNAVRRPSFECFSGRGAAVSLALSGKAYQVNVVVGALASKQRVAEALAVGRSFRLHS